MRFATTTELRQPKAWEGLQEEKVVVTNHGKPIAMLIPLDEEHFEDILAQVNRMEAIQSLRTLQTQAREAGVDSMSVDQIDEEIRAARKRRRARRP